MKKKGKKGLAVAMTLAVTVTSVPMAFAADEESQLMTLPEWSGEKKAKETVWKYEKLDQAPMKESVKASSENTEHLCGMKVLQILHLMEISIQDGIQTMKLMNHHTLLNGIWVEHTR